MPADEAGGILSQRGVVVSFGSQTPKMSRKALRKRFSASRFTSPETRAGDLATHLHKWGQPGREAVALYSSDVAGAQVITGIDYYFAGTPSASSGFGTPTKTVVEMIEGMKAPTYIFAAEPDLDQQNSLTFLDACNEPYVGHIPAATFSCDVQGRPKKAFMFIRSGERGISMLSIRDASVARASIAHKNGD
ncbi:hypothetical protein [Sphingobium sp. AntQ-1]|uniref:hypothetical protein n=1 Tax=Sphingobium sp. AntQ-1 TaxID=2930091 RepID=UPI00234EA8AB|nr:hypothetical protein [Sphingobium sp. AntQ-1]